MPLVEETFCATGAAFAELAAVARQQGLDDAAWASLLASLPEKVRAALAESDPKAAVDEKIYAAALHALDEKLGNDGTFAREVGRARGEAVLATERATFEGDPLRFLKLAAGEFYRDRLNYGASSLELTGKKAILRFIFSPHLTLKIGENNNKGPLVVLGYLEHTASELAGDKQPARYTGNAKRADTRFGRRSTTSTSSSTSTRPPLPRGHSVRNDRTYSSPRRCCLLRALCFFSAMRRSTLPRVGRVGRRRTGRIIACATRARTLSRASSRFCS
jgi:hypothetical protein